MLLAHRYVGRKKGTVKIHLLKIGEELFARIALHFESLGTENVFRTIYIHRMMSSTPHSASTRLRGSSKPDTEYLFVPSCALQPFGTIFERMVNVNSKSLTS